MARVHGSLMDHDGGEIVDVLRRVDTLLVLLHSVGEHVQGNGEVNVAIHFLRGGLVVLIALEDHSESDLSSFY